MKRNSCVVAAALVLLSGCASDPAGRVGGDETKQVLWPIRIREVQGNVVAVVEQDGTRSKGEGWKARAFTWDGGGLAVSVLPPDLKSWRGVAHRPGGVLKSEDDGRFSLPVVDRDTGNMRLVFVTVPGIDQAALPGVTGVRESFPATWSQGNIPVKVLNVANRSGEIYTEGWKVRATFFEGEDSSLHAVVKGSELLDFVSWEGGLWRRVGRSLILHATRPTDGETFLIHARVQS